MGFSYTVNRERWSKMSIFEQMGNISSEVGRSFNAKRRRDDEACLKAVSRALDLFDATVSSLIERKSAKSKEVLRAKEIYLATVLDDTCKDEDMQSLERYFTQFAVAARLHR